MDTNKRYECDYCNRTFSNVVDKVVHQGKCLGTKNCTPDPNEANEKIIELLTRIAEMTERTALAVEIIERKAEDTVSLLNELKDIAEAEEAQTTCHLCHKIHGRTDGANVCHECSANIPL